MASKIVTLLVDDIDGSNAAETVRFGLDGTQYEIDLNSKHAEELRALAAPYVASARRAAATGQVPARTRKASRNGNESRKIRDWAKSEGIEVNDRGRVPADVVARYEAANN
jgi:hypothetical protein